jgi:hypothetical protein
MIVKNKTKYTQKIYLKDGSVQIVRPERADPLRGEPVEELNSAVFEVQGKTTTKKTTKGE